MTQNNTDSIKNQAADDVSETQVAAYLRQHNDFFARHPELLQHQHIPHQSGTAISLVERQTALLRQKNTDIREQMSDLLDAARHNDLQFEKTKRLILSLVEAHSLDEVLVAIDEGLCQDFNGDITQLILFDAPKDGSYGSARVLPLASAEEQVTELIESDWAICGSLTSEQRRFLFGEQSEKILSAAVVPLIKGRTLGLLAIGSYEANYFHSSMGTLFLSYVGEVLSRILYRLVFNDKRR